MIMDYEAEQASELEALDSIYCDDMEILEEKPAKFAIHVRSGPEESDEAPECRLVVVYTPKYPDEMPEVSIDSVNELSEEEAEELLKHIVSAGEEQLGMVMVFTLVSAAQEWMAERLEKRIAEREANEAALKKKHEEAEQKRFEGTRVTVETFIAWRTRFEMETGVAARRERDARDSKKLTGRDLFLRDTTLNSSDLKFLDDGDAVKVDESLFQELDDLDLDDEDDDPDYVPGDDD